MPYSVYDLLGLVLAAAIAGPLIILPGLAVGRVGGLVTPETPARLVVPLALVSAYAVLPAVDSLAARLLGLFPALVLHLALTMAGLFVLSGLRLARPSRGVLLGAAIWLAALALAWIDLDWRGELNQSLLVKDMIKHAATVRAMVDTGVAPPSDVFFHRDGLAGYYYYYYVLSAFIERIGLGLVDSRAAVGGQVFWTGLAVLSLALVLVSRLRRHAGASALPVVAALVAAAGLEVVTVALIGLASGVWYAQVAWWKEGIGALVHSTLWVPHHLAAVIAAWGGLLALAGAIEGRKSAGLAVHDLKPVLPAVVFAGAAFASTLGLSVWVTLGAIAIVGLWGLCYVAERRFGEVGLIVLAGVLSVVVSIPHIFDLATNRAYDGFPIAFAVRGFPLDGLFAEGTLAQTLARLVWLPINLVLGLGVLAVGAVLWWRRAAARRALASETGLLLLLGALAGLVISSLFKSTIVNNDLGWRVLLFAQISALVWTAAALVPFARLARRRFAQSSAAMPAPKLAGAMLAMLAIGWAGTAYEIVGLRASHALGLKAFPRVDDHQAIDHDARRAYEWANASVPRSSVVQHNPDTRYALGFGLYGRNPVAVAPSNLGSLFGASRADVAARLADITPVFNDSLAASEARARLARHGVGHVLVTSADAVWRDSKSWVWTAAPLFAGEHVRVFDVRSLAP